MSAFAAKYKIPPELDKFIDSGFLELLSETDAEKTLEFHIPSKVSEDDEGRITSYAVFWIHPDFNAEFCHYFDKQPGDLPNFYAEVDTTDLGNDIVSDLSTVADLSEWLESMKSASAV